MLIKRDISVKLISNITNSELVNDKILVKKNNAEIQEYKETQVSEESINGTELFSFFTANVIQCDEIFVR